MKTWSTANSRKRKREQPWLRGDYRHRFSWQIRHLKPSPEFFEYLDRMPRKVTIDWKPGGGEPRELTPDEIRAGEEALDRVA